MNGVVEYHLARGGRAIYYFQGREQTKTRHKPNLPKPKGPHQLWSHRRKPDHYKDLGWGDVTV